MKTRIDPSRVRRLMEQRRIRGAKDLAARLNASERTVRRLLSGKLSDKPRALSLERLARVLGTEPDVLTGETPLPESSEQEREERGGYVRLNVKIGAAEYNALVLNELRYGVPLTTQIELAALLFHIVAQRSLRHRAETLARVQSAFDELARMGEKEAPHLPPFCQLSANLEDALDAEVRSIEQEDIFAEKTDPWVEYPEAPNPLQEEIRRLADEVQDVTVATVEKDFVMYSINHKHAFKLAAEDGELAEAILYGGVSMARLRHLLGDEKTQERVAELRRRWEEAGRQPLHF